MMRGGCAERKFDHRRIYDGSYGDNYIEEGGTDRNSNINSVLMNVVSRCRITL